MNARKQAMGGKIPELKSTLRKLYMKTHPDLFGQFPEQQRTNENSYKELLGVLDTIQAAKNGFPPARKLVLPFYLREKSETQEFRMATLKLRTTGGNCKALVEEALGDFFQDCGLKPGFKWPASSWGTFASIDELRQHQKEEEEEAENKNHQPESAPAYWGTQAPVVDHSIDALLEQNDDVFKIIAACPWLDEEYKDVRNHFQVEGGLDEYEKNGYKIKNAVHSIWNGERDINQLIVGVTIESAQIIQRILMHTMDIESQLTEDQSN